MRRRYHCSKKEAWVAIEDRLDRRKGERGLWVFGFGFEEREKGKTRWDRDMTVLLYQRERA